MATQLSPAPTARASTGTGGQVEVSYTSYNAGEGGYRLSQRPTQPLSPLSDDGAPTVVVDPSMTYQTWDGWGSTFEDTTIYHLTRLSPANREAALQALFSEANGNNFNLMRTTIGCPDFCRDYDPSKPDSGFWTYDDTSSPDPTLAHFSLQRDIDSGRLGVIRDALRINPDLQLFASMWSPPAWMKTSGSIIGPVDGNCSDQPANYNTVKHGAATGSSVDYYPVLAQYYVKYIQAYQARGIPIAYVSLGNEPDITRSYPTTCFTPAQQADVARALRSAFDAAGLTTQVWGLDDNLPNTFPVADELLAAPATNPAVDGLGFHNYGGTKMWQPSAVAAQWPNKSMHLTEITQGANKLIEYLRSGVSSYDGWGMMFQLREINGVLYSAYPAWWQDKEVPRCDPGEQPPACDPDSVLKSVLTPKDGDPRSFDLNQYYYIFGQFSRYLQIGAVRIDSPDRIGNLYNVAFQNPDGTIVVIVVNRPDTRYISTKENTPAQRFRIATPDGEVSDTIPGDTIATYKITPTTGGAASRAGWTASASNTYDAYTATQAVDGQSGTSWLSGTDQAPGQSFTVDLGAARRFDQLTLNQLEHSGDFPQGYELRTSTDGRTWSGVVASGTGTPGLTNITFPARTGRYARVTLTAPAARWWSIGEVSVFDSASGLLPRGPAATATASSTSADTAAASAIDGSMTTAWSSGHSQAVGQSFVLDRGVTTTFNAMELDAGVNSGDFPRSYQVQVSNDGSTWSAPVATGNGQNHEQYVDVGQQSARYVRISLTSAWAANWWTIRELRVLNLAPTALSRSGWTGTASSTASGTSPADALDANASTRWNSGLAQADGQWFQVDLHAEQYLRALRLDAGSATSEYGRCTRIRTSIDGISWRTVADVVGTGAANRVLFPVHLARFVRVEQTCAASSNWSIAGLDVYAVTPAAPTTTSLSHSGWTVTTSPAGDGAQQAVDGLLDTRWTTGAAPVGGEQFQVDLGAMRTFRGVQLNAAGPVNDEGGDYPRGYEVYTSTNGTSWTKVAAGAGRQVVVNAYFAPRTARYVRVRQTGSAPNVWWSVAEFNVLK